MKLTITPNGTTATTDDDTVRVGEEVRFATIEEALTESRRMGERNREALDRAEVEGQPHYWNEQHHRDEHDRIWRVWVKTSFAELRREKELREFAKRHGPVYDDGDGNRLTGAEAIEAFNADIDEQQTLRKKLARAHPREWALYCQAKGYVDAPPVRRMSTPQGRAPRAATNTHRRGSRRGERSRSSSSDDPDPDAEPRACEWCGASIEHRRAGARHCSAAHRARAWRAAQRVEPFEPLASVPRPCDACPHLATLPDEDGDPICVVCGTLVGAPSSPNGHEAIFAHMVTDGEGQRRRVARRRRLGPGRWGGLVTRLPSDAAMRPRPVHYKRAAPVVADAAERGT